MELRSVFAAVAAAAALCVTGGVAAVALGAAVPAQGTTTITTTDSTGTITLIVTDTTPTTTGPTVPGAPTLTSAVALASGGIRLTWKQAPDGGSPITRYRIYRRAGDNALAPLGTIWAGADEYTDTSAEPGATYWYAVSAINDVGEGPLSDERSATALPPPTAELFAAHEAISVGSWPEAVAVGDVTGDGRNDVVMTTSFYFSPESDYRLFVFAGRADGTLAPPVSHPTGGAYTSRPLSVAIGDITGDWRNDVVVALSGVGVEVYPQLADGTLGSPAFTPTRDSDKIRLGDLNGDPAPDIAGIGSATNTVSVLLNDGAGRFRSPLVYPAKHAGYDDLEVADVTGDERDDLVVMSGQLYATPNVSVLSQLPGGGFGAAAEYWIGTNILTRGIGVGDVTGDGRNDVVASYGGNRPSSQLAVFAQLPDGTLGAPRSHASYDIPEPVEVADLDVDGRFDAVTLHGGWNAAGVYLQSENGVFADERRFALPYATRYNPHGLAVGDVDGNWSPDVVVADYNHGLVLLRNRTPVPPFADVPGLPTLTSATAGDADVALLWDAPASDYGAPITAYRIYRGTASGAATPYARVGPTARRWVDTAVSGGTTYRYQVSALNLMGEGGRSNELSATPTVPVTVPGAPTLTSAAAGNGSVALGWSPPASNGGAPVTGYRVYRGTTAGSETFLAALGNVTAYTDTTAANGTTYSYKVSAVNAVGEGTRSNALSATPATVPGAPTLTSAAAGNASVALGWTPPASNGGAAVTGYRVLRGTAAGSETFLAAVGNVTAYTDTTASNGTTYSYRVSAVNSVGEGARSNALSATPRVPDTTPPTAPASLRLVVAGTNQLALDWAPSTDNVGVTGYRVYRGGVLVATVDSSQHLDAGLLASTTYAYRVAAIDAAGNASALSSALNAKTGSAGSGTNGILAGAVFDATGRPLANAVVALSPSGGTKSIKTSSSGAWKSGNLPAGSYSVTIGLSGYGSQTFAMSVVAGKTVLAATVLEAP